MTTPNEQRATPGMKDLAGPSRKVAFLAAVGAWFLCGLPLMLLDHWTAIPEKGLDFLRTATLVFAAMVYVEIRRIPAHRARTQGA